MDNKININKGSGINRMHYKFVVWCKHCIPKQVYVLILSAIIGCLSGLGAYILKELISIITTYSGQLLNIKYGNFLFVILPFFGIVMVGAFMKYVLKHDISHGVSRLIQNLTTHNFNIAPSTCITPILCSSATIGLGGSVGSEGPIAYSGAAIGNNIANWFKLSPQMTLIMIGCGAGAGISGIFKAPIGGVLFALEVLKLHISSFAVIALIVASLTSWIVVYICTGETCNLSFIPKFDFNTEYLPAIIVLGIICGLYSLYYSFIMNKMDNFYKKFKTSFHKNIVGGIVLALILFVFPMLYGEGYQIIKEIINDDIISIMNRSIFINFSQDKNTILYVLGGIVILKAFATSTTNSSGGVGGDFAPTLFVGSIIGYLFATLSNNLLFTTMPTGFFALGGMSGAMSGITRAPLMAIFITIEMTGAYQFLLPVLITSIISFAMVYFIPQLDFISRRSHEHDDNK